MPIYPKFEGAQVIGGGKDGDWEGTPDNYSAYQARGIKPLLTCTLAILYYRDESVIIKL